MTTHVAPHRWADAYAGRVEDPEREAMELHARSCRRCARARDRITRASGSFVAIRETSSPELSWDEVRARVHWSVSTERRERVARSRRGPLLAWSAVGALAAGAVAVAIATDSALPEQFAVRPGASVAETAAPRPSPAPDAPAALVGVVNRATGDVMIDGIRSTDLFARRLVAGTRLATGKGRVDVQFADASAFALGPRSMLELRRFDADTIELVVDGTVDLEVAPRAQHQVFVVRAGDRVIEVRGTQFRVRHDEASTTVACRHGLVAVRDAKGQVEVGASSRLELVAGRDLTAQRVAPLSADEVDDLARATPMTLSYWSSPDTILQGSAPLDIATVGRRDVRVDGVELGLAPMRVRVMPGRHTVEVADHAGRYRRAGWVDVSTAAGATPARVEVPAEQPRTRGTVQRRRQFDAGIDKGRLASCTRSIARSGMTGTYVQIEIAVDAQGAVNFLNVIDTDLGTSTASCVREVLADVRFKAGAAATWRQRIDL